VRARLVEICGGRAVVTTPLTLPQTLVGRDPAADVFIGHDRVSRRHAVIRRVRGGHEILDLESGNGTAVNGERIGQAVPLDPGDRIELAGEVMLIYETSGAGARWAAAFALLVFVAGGAGFFWWRSQQPDPILRRAADRAAEAVAAWERGEKVTARKGLQVAAGLLYSNGYLDHVRRAEVMPAAFAMIERDRTFDRDLNVIFRASLADEQSQPISKTPIQPDACRLGQVPAADLEPCIQEWVGHVMAALRQDPSDVPADFYREVGRRMLRERGFIDRSLRRGESVVPLLKAELEGAKMPPLLHYLALIESGYRPDAGSPAGAGGLWQFMPPTARHYGLAVGKGLDERRDVEKSTRAAARYLRDLVFEFGGNSLLLALAGYNRGENGVRRALKRLDDPFSDRSYWRLVEADLLPEETAQYVTRFMAAAVAGEGGLPRQEVMAEAGF
jgi:hypothetical protein